MGKGSTTARVAVKKGEPLHVAFDRAVDQALDQLSSDLGTGNYPVSVQFGLEVEVTNPGKVGFVKATLTNP
jgi:hypothetical protein